MPLWRTDDSSFNLNDFRRTFMNAGSKCLKMDMQPKWSVLKASITWLVPPHTVNKIRSELHTCTYFKSLDFFQCYTITMISYIYVKGNKCTQSIPLEDTLDIGNCEYTESSYGKQDL